MVGVVPTISVREKIPPTSGGIFCYTRDMTNNEERKIKAHFTYVSRNPSEDSDAWYEAICDMNKLTEAGFHCTPVMHATTPEELTITFGVW